jgi:tetratricopeptide (TPR) repeat protein
VTRLPFRERSLPGVHADQDAYVAGRDQHFYYEVGGPVVAEPRSFPAPCQLPLDVSAFTGRDSEISELDEWLLAPSPTAIALVAGTPGVGKTALAVHWAHRVRDQFTGGVLFADLHGYDQFPASPTQILPTFLRALGLPDNQVPTGQDELETTYRSLLEHHASAAGNVLVLIDNASSSAQVRALLPGSGAHRVLVTSRHRLSDLDGVRPVNLDVLNIQESLALLAAGDRSSDRLSREPEAAREIAVLCGYLPLALRITAVLLIDDPAQPVSELASSLRDKKHRLAELQYGDDLAVRAAFDLSYARLSEAERRMFRLLSLATGDQISKWTAMALADLGEREVTKLLAGLCRAHMLQQSEARHWYQFHDLIRLYASRKSEEEDSPGEVDDAVDRMLMEFYSSVAHAVDDLSSRSPEEAERRQGASTWLRMEHLTLIEAVELAHRTGRHLCAAMLADRFKSYLRNIRRWADAARVLEFGLKSAVERGGTEYEATLRCDLAVTLGFLDRRQEAIGHLTRALQIARELGDRRFEAVMLMELGRAHQRLGDTAKAGECYRTALEIFTEAGDNVYRANVLLHIGTLSLDANDADSAVDTYNRALNLFHQTNSLGNIAATKRLLASVYLNQLDRLDLAFDHYDEARQFYHDIGDHHNEADMWYEIGLICVRDGRSDVAQSSWRVAMLLARHIDYDDLVEHLELMFTRHGLTPNDSTEAGVLIEGDGD